MTVMTMMMTTPLCWIYVVLGTVTVLFVKECQPLKDVNLRIEPRVVARSGESQLRCDYDLEGAALYSVKWYRGRYEFYRYTPHENPETKIFPLKGLTVNVSNSNGTHVLLNSIDFNVSGNFTCEVTTDAPYFSTATDTQTMLVVELPEYPPTISVSREPLDYGDTLRANCSCSPSRPRATLTFYLNDIMVGRTAAVSGRELQETAWSDLRLELPLERFHFRGDGRLELRCVAEIEDAYRDEAVLRLSSAREPVPERVSAYDSSDRSSSQSTINSIILLIYYTILFIVS